MPAHTHGHSGTVNRHYEWIIVFPTFFIKPNMKIFCYKLISYYYYILFTKKNLSSHFTFVYFLSSGFFLFLFITYTLCSWSLAQEFPLGLLKSYWILSYYHNGDEWFQEFWREFICCSLWSNKHIRSACTEGLPPLDSRDGGVNLVCVWPGAWWVSSSTLVSSHSPKWRLISACALW